MHLLTDAQQLTLKLRLLVCAVPLQMAASVMVLVVTGHGKQ